MNQGLWNNKLRFSVILILVYRFFITLFISVLSLPSAQSATLLSEENTPIKLKAWCENNNGKWVENACGWSEVDLNEPLEESLNQECGDRAGVWQTLREGIYGSSYCGAGVCTLDLVLIDYSLTGVGCVWYRDIQSPGNDSD